MMIGICHKIKALHISFVLLFRRNEVSFMCIFVFPMIQLVSVAGP